MKYPLAALLSLTLLAACGADGRPQPPQDDMTPGAHVSGEARIGVRKTFN